MKRVFQEFREFAMRGNVLDLAVGVIIGGAFGLVVTSFTRDVLTPPLELLRPADFRDLFFVLRPGVVPPPYPSLAAAIEAGAVTLNIGAFIDALISFIITAVALFLLLRAINAAKRREEHAPPVGPTTKKCPFCLSDLPIAAVRCAYCTSHLPAAEQEAGEVQIATAP
jgi:large conductance mechanosensitive channel